MQTRNEVYHPDERGENVVPASQYGAEFVDGSLRTVGVMAYEAGSPWAIQVRAGGAGGQQVLGRAVLGEDGRPPVFQELPRKLAATVGTTQAYVPMDDLPGALTNLLVTGSTRIACVNLPRWEAQRQAVEPFATLIRQTVTTSEEHPADQPSPPILAPPLSYQDNSVRFEYAANTFAFGAVPQYQTRLLNFGAGKWPDFSSRNVVNYLNFAFGSFLDEIRAAFRPRLSEEGPGYQEERAPGLPARVHTDRGRLL